MTDTWKTDEIIATGISAATNVKDAGVIADNAVMRALLVNFIYATNYLAPNNDRLGAARAAAWAVVRDDYERLQPNEGI